MQADLHLTDKDINCSCIAWQQQLRLSSHIARLDQVPVPVCGWQQAIAARQVHHHKAHMQKSHDVLSLACSRCVVSTIAFEQHLHATFSLSVALIASAAAKCSASRFCFLQLQHYDGKRCNVSSPCIF